MVSGDWERALALATVALLAACAPQKPTRDYKVKSYFLRGSFDWDSETLKASEDVTLDLVPFKSSLVELDSKVKVGRVHAGTRTLAWSADESILRVDLSPVAGLPLPITFTVDYEAPVSASLIVGGARDGDPLTTRAVFTNSEPDRTPLWLVVDDAPAARARWSVELSVDETEDVVANGKRIRDDVVGGRRVVRYALDKPIPPYQLAFAAGDLVHEDRTDGRVPLSVWFRRGLRVDPNRTFDDVSDAMATFEALLGPYPWDSYSVVLLPQFSGAMENATVTFSDEAYGQGSGNFDTQAHELSHHWFGDWVTMQRFEDAWVKEGMATLLEAEADRTRRDEEGRGRLFGRDFTFRPTEAIVDPELAGLDRYNTGIYMRAAWTISQIRLLIGEEAFWSHLRQVLDRHALGAIDGPAFVRSFAPELDEATIVRVIDALPSHEAPQITVSASTSSSVTLSLTDPGQVLIAPVTLTAVSASAEPVSLTLSEEPTTVTVPRDGYLALDERDVHPRRPIWPTSLVGGTSLASSLGRQLFPKSLEAIPAFCSRSAAHQELAFESALPPLALAVEVGTFYGTLDSSDARTRALSMICEVREHSLPDARFETFLSPLLQNPSRAQFDVRYGVCGENMVNRLFGAELTAMVDDLDHADVTRLEYLLSFHYGASTLPLVSKVAKEAPSLYLRDVAVYRLVVQRTSGWYWWSRPPNSQYEEWNAVYRDLLTVTTSAARFNLLWPVCRSDRLALPIAAQLLHTVPLTSTVQRQVVCDAWSRTQSSLYPEDWSAFQEVARPWDTLAPEAAAVLADPNTCGQPKMADDESPLESGASGKAALEGRRHWMSQGR